MSAAGDAYIAQQLGISVEALLARRAARRAPSWRDETDYPDGDDCATCAGTGLGQSEMTCCYACGGSGIHTPPRHYYDEHVEP